MTDLQQKSLQGAALYNPHLHGKQELVGLFFVRRKLLDLLREDLRATSAGQSPQHHLLIGQRGMGKTMLLHRLGYAIEDDLGLSQSFLPLTFPEEQYNVARLSDFWFNCTDALSDALERMGRSQEAADLDEKAGALRLIKEERRSKQALALLTGTAKALGRRLVLLIDNIDLILDRIHQQDWDLREALSDQPFLVLIGASANAVESSYTYDRAFYDFFRVHELEGLDLEETRRLIIHYAEIWDTPDVKRLAEGDAPRIRVLHNLTGGNPRTIALLYNVLALGVEGDVRSDLEKLLDQCTPLYKARFEALPPQAQQVVHAMAVHWDPISAGELAESLAIEVNAVSSQLARLVKQGVAEKVEYEPESKTGFQIAERFFNIWYLMRASRRVRRRLLWLVEFLKIFYEQEQLQAKAFAHIESGLNLDTTRRLRYAEYSFALADAVSDRTWRRSLEKTGLYALLRDDSLRGQLTDLIDLESEPGLKERAEYQQRLEQARSNVVSTQMEIPGWSGEDFWVKLKNSLLLPLAAKVWIALKKSVELDSENPNAWHNLSSTLENLGRYEEAAEAEKKVIELDPEDAAAWQNLGFVLEKLERYTEAEQAHKKVVDLSPDNANAWTCLGWVLQVLERHEEAEGALRKALEVDPENVLAWGNLGIALWQLRRPEEAEQAFRMAITLNESAPSFWSNLGVMLEALGRIEDAEQAYWKAVEIAPHIPIFRIQLAWFLLLRRGRYEAAETLAREALEIGGEAVVSAHGILAVALVQRGDWSEAAKHAKRSILTAIDHDAQGNWSRNLAFFREAVRAGKARDAVELLEDIGVAERWRPLREALEAIARGKDSYLRRVAPEVRLPARQILRQLREELPLEARGDSIDRSALSHGEVSGRPVRKRKR